MTIKLSPSRLNLLEECPKCFWLEVVKGVSRPRGIFPSLPSGVDRLLKLHFDRFRKIGKLPPELKNKTSAKLFRDMELLNKWRSNLKGIQHLDQESGILLRGAVDEILVKGKKLIVLDFKTRGFALKEDTAHHYQDQLNLYNFLLRKNGYKTEDYAYLLFYVPEKINGNGSFIFRTELIKMKINVRHAEELFRKAIQVLKGSMPESSEECEFCRWIGEFKGGD